MSSEVKGPSPVPVVVVNPASAGGSTGRRWPELEASIRQELGEFRPVFTQRIGHATELARAALRGGSQLVVAMGGDGTINEVVNGFFAGDGDGALLAPGAAFAVLPAGTGGDFIKTTGTPRRIADAARAIARARPRPIDVGRLSFVANDGRPGARHFINIASFGIAGLVDRYVNRSSKPLGGLVAFFTSTIRATVNYRNPRCRITLDDAPAIERAVYNVAVSNGRYFGGGMKVAPDAQLDDGLFDVVVIGDVGKLEMIVKGLKIYDGTHIHLPFVSVARARKVVAEPINPGTEVLLDVDGEAPGRLPASFEVLAGAIQLRG